MKRYINKDTLIAEIERILLIYTKRYDELAKYEVWATAKEIKYRIQGLKEALSILNNIEVKEVDLEKHLKEDIEDVLFDLNGVAVKGATHYLTVEDVKDIAKYFFELGMTVNNTQKEKEKIIEYIDKLLEKYPKNYYLLMVAEFIDNLNAQKEE